MDRVNEAMMREVKLYPLVLLAVGVGIGVPATTMWQRSWPKSRTEYFPHAVLQLRLKDLTSGDRPPPPPQGGDGGCMGAGLHPDLDNEYEELIREEMIPAPLIGLRFSDVGGLAHVKEALQELVILPLRRPKLFRRGSLVEPCKGILLFGPPGTGKTMLAKALACETGASFINLSMSTIACRWFGEGEKFVRAVFSLAARVAPTIVFIDEVDSMLGHRSAMRGAGGGAGEHEAMRSIKNEFMTCWDGLLSKAETKVLVLAATNRPYDLDDAVVRRFERRIMVDLPDKACREKILRATICKEPNISEDVSLSEIAGMTHGYSGSDLKILCKTAAYRPIRELIKMEQSKMKEAPTTSSCTSSTIASHAAEGCNEAAARDDDIAAIEEETLEQEEEAKDNIVEEESTDNEAIPKEEDGEEEEVTLRPLSMEDLKQAKQLVSSSFAMEGGSMAELKQWNELYGEGGSRKKQVLTYFL